MLLYSNIIVNSTQIQKLFTKIHKKQPSFVDHLKQFIHVHFLYVFLIVLLFYISHCTFHFLEFSFWKVRFWSSICSSCIFFPSIITTYFLFYVSFHRFVLFPVFGVFIHDWFQCFIFFRNILVSFFDVTYFLISTFYS